MYYIYFIYIILIEGAKNVSWPWLSSLGDGIVITFQVKGQLSKQRTWEMD